MFNNYEAIKELVFSKALREDERNRINEEISIFEKRKWGKYVTLTVNLLSQLSDEKHFFVHFSKSALDSYFIFKALHPNEINDNLLRCVRSKDIIFNDTLRLDIECAGLLFCLKAEFAEVATIVEDEIKKSKLHYYENLIDCERADDKGELIIVSQNSRNDSEIRDIINERTLNVDDDLIRDCLLVRLFFKNRL